MRSILTVVVVAAFLAGCSSSELDDQTTVTGGAGRRLIRTGGAPADIAVDTERNRVAVPFVDRNLVEIWQLSAQR